MGMDSNTEQRTPTPLYILAPDRPRLRVVVLLAASELPGWLDETLLALRKAAFLDVRVLRLPDAPARRVGSPAWRAFSRLDHRLLGHLEPIMALRAPNAALQGETVEPGDRPLRDAVARFTPDVLLSVGLSPAPVDLWSLARRAAWSIPAEACRPGFGLAHLLPAFARGDATAVSGLPVRDDRTGNDLLLDPAVISLAQLSFARNVAFQLQKAPAKMLRALWRIHQGEPELVTTSRGARPPGSLATLGLALRLAARAARRHLPRIGRRDRWEIASRRSVCGLDPATPSGEDFIRWPTPRGWFWADPFPVTRDGREYVFFEALDYARGIGEIHVAEVDAEGRPGTPRVAIRDPLHLSYPFPFDHQGEPHLLVERSESFLLQAFRASDFPLGWAPVATLLEGWRAVDATLVEHGGRWWLFACIAETPFHDGGREFNDLFLFHSESPLGPWTPHRQNPVVTDVRNSRPAGPLFVRDGRLIRPSQDGGAEYGRRIVFNEVLRLDPLHYEETELAALEPDWAPDMRGCHTYARCGTLEVLDARFLVPAAQTRAPR